MTKKVLTLCIPHTEIRVLLGMKKRGFGEGRWNGFGGKIEPGETIEAAAKRELFEEAGLLAQILKKRAIFEFEFDGNPEVLEIHVFSVPSFEGEATETEEMRPQWFLKNELPFDSMWPDDRLWFPSFLEGKSLTGKF
ncbi:MAG: 8-oxo-dGTP diphosphatase, partial [Candidatus Sungbacteria bacterium]|nr:8-oxo-dGTP diphosphatase [Candidatus Sungbacteria bacterium]